MKTDEVLARCAQGKTWEERQAIALEIHGEMRPRPTGFDRFVAFALFFGPMIVGCGVAWWLH